MKARNRFMAVLLAFMMVVTYMPALAFAEEVPDSEPPAETEEQVVDEETVPSDIDAVEESEEPSEAADTVKKEKKEALTEAPTETAQSEAAQDGSGTEEEADEQKPKITGFELILSPTRTGDDKQIWGYVGDWYPQNFPMEGDKIIITYDNGDKDTYIGGEITEEGPLEGAVNIHLVDESGKIVYETQPDGSLFPILIIDTDDGVGEDMMTTLSEGVNKDYYMEFIDRYDNTYLYKTTAIGRAEEGMTFTYSHAGEITVYEGINGWMESEGEGDSETNYFYYSWDALPVLGDTVTISKDGTTRTYTYNSYTVKEEDGTAYEWRGFADCKNGVIEDLYNDTIDDDEICFTDDQETNHWKVGNTYNGSVYYHGVKSTSSIKVNVAANPAKSLTFTPNGKTELSVNDITKTGTDENGEEYKDVNLMYRGDGNDPYFFVEGDKLTVTYNEGSGLEAETYTYSKRIAVDGEEYYVWIPEDGGESLEGVFVTDEKGEYPGEPVEGENTVYISYYGVKIPVKVNVTGISEEHIHDWEFVDFTWTEEGGGYTAVANYICTIDESHTETVEAVVSKVSGTEPTCDAAGSAEFKAEVAAEDSLDQIAHEDTNTRSSDALGHDWEFVDFTWTGNDEDGYTAAVANYVCKNDASHTETVNATVTSETTDPTCEAAGKTVYTAKVAEADSLDGAEQTGSKEVAIAALGHDWEFVDFTWTEAGGGYTAVANYICKTDETHTQTVEAAVSKVSGTEPTCDAAGSAEFKAEVAAEDSLDKTAHEDTKTRTSDALGHDWKFVDFTWTGSDEAGYTAAVANYVCKNDENHKKTVNATVTSETTDPTCEADGKTVYTATVAKADSPDGAEQSANKEVAIDAIGHDWEFVDFTWTEAGGGYTAVANYKCKNDASHTETVDATVSKVSGTEPTCEAAGSAEFKAEVTAAASLDKAAHEDSKTRTADALGHDWKFVDFTWTGNDEDGYTAAVANYVCKNDESHKKTANATVASETTDPTCEADGKTVYTATVAKADSPDGAEQSDSKEVAIEKLGHDWGEPTYKWADDNKSVTAERVCKRDASHKETETAAVTAEVTKPATCEAKGETTYTPGAFSNEAFETQAPKALEDVEALGHDWGEGEVTTKPTYKEAGERTYTCAHDDSHVKTEEIPSLKDQAEAAAKTPGAAAVAAAEEAEKAAEEAYNKAKEAAEAAPDDEEAAAALAEAEQDLKDAQAATQKAKDAKAAAEAAAAVPAEVLDYSLPTIKNYKPTRGKTWIKARWKKLSKKNRKKVDGIEIQFSSNGSFTGGNVWTKKKTARTQKIKGLERKTYYYTRVRTYKYVGGVKHVSRWSKIKIRKTK